MEEDDDDVAFLTKNFNMFLKKMEKWSKSGPKATKPTKVKNPSKSNIFTNKNKGVQCKECDGFGHVQSKLANILKKKKAMNTLQSD